MKNQSLFISAFALSASISSAVLSDPYQVIDQQKMTNTKRQIGIAAQNAVSQQQQANMLGSAQITKDVRHMYGVECNNASKVQPTADCKRWLRESGQLVK